MKYDLKLADGDLALDAAGNASLIGGAEKVAQQVRLTLMIFLGDWFLDQTFGVPYFESILGKNRSMSEIEAVVRARVNAVPDVVALTGVSVKIDKPTRVGTITLTGLQTLLGIVQELKVNFGGD